MVGGIAKKTIWIFIIPEEFVGLLGKDGLLTAQLIRANASPQMASLVVGEMFCAFVRAKKTEAKRKARKDMQKHKNVDNYATLEAGGGTLHMWSAFRGQYEFSIDS